MTLKQPFWGTTPSPSTPRARGRRVARLALPFLLTSGCGSGIITPEGTPPDTLFNVRGEARGGLDADVAGQLRAALTWRVYGNDLIACLDTIEITRQLDLSDDVDEAIARRLEACLFETERGRRETSSVDIESEFPLSFNIPVQTLPDPALLSGTEGTRLGLADVLVYADGNGNGTFDETPRGALAFVDLVHGTSLPLREDETDVIRSYSSIVYREGAVSPLWKLYRAIYGCGDPPVGFSTMTLTVNEAGTEVTCVFDDSPLPVTLSDDVGRLGCAADPQSHVLNRAADAAWPAGARGSCAGPEYVDEILSITTEVDSVCPSFREYSLVGCSDSSSEETCEATSWDDTDNVPAWWPCKSGTGAYVGYNVDERYVTDAPDDVLFEHLWYDGIGEMSLDELTFQFRALGENDVAFVVGSQGLTLIDNDGNGVFNAGDRLRVREVGNLFTTATTGTYGVVLARNGEPLNIFNPSFYQPVQPPPQPPVFSAFSADASAPITDGIDDLCTVFHQGLDFDPYRFPFAALRAELVVGEGNDAVTISVSAADGSLVFVDDRDGDGMFESGDTLLLRDPVADLAGSIHPALLAERGSGVRVHLISPFDGGVGVVASTFVRLE